MSSEMVFIKNIDFGKKLGAFKKGQTLEVKMQDEYGPFLMEKEAYLQSIHAPKDSAEIIRGLNSEIADLKAQIEKQGADGSKKALKELKAENDAQKVEIADLKSQIDDLLAKPKQG